MKNDLTKIYPEYVHAIVEIDVPKWQIGEKASVHFRDTMCTTGIAEKLDDFKTRCYASHMQLCDFLKICHVNAIDLVHIDDCIKEINHLVGYEIQEYADCAWEITAIYMGDNGCLQILCDNRRKEK